MQLDAGTYLFHVYDKGKGAAGSAHLAVTVRSRYLFADWDSSERQRQDRISPDSFLLAHFVYWNENRVRPWACRYVLFCCTLPCVLVSPLIFCCSSGGFHRWFYFLLPKKYTAAVLLQHCLIVPVDNARHRLNPFHIPNLLSRVARLLRPWPLNPP